MSLWSGLKSLGLLELLVYAPEYSAELVRHRLDRFDRVHGTDTNTSVAVDDLAGIGANQQSAELYWPIRAKPFERMMAASGRDLQPYTFIDLGAGKGRALLLATDFPFQRLIGVEFSPALCEVARRNLRLFAERGRPLAAHAEIACADACSYVFPEGPLLVFLFDPFGPEVLRPVIANLVASLERVPRPCVIAYYLPMHEDLFRDAGFVPVARQRRGLHLAYPWVVLQRPVPISLDSVAARALG